MNAVTKFEDLHNAIIEVVRSGAKTAQEIEDRIEKENLWRRPSDGTSPPVKQIRARVTHKKYAHLFQILDGKISLK